MPTLPTEHQTEANRQLQLVVEYLESLAHQGSVNLFSARDAAAAAQLLERPDLVRRVEATVAGLTTKDLYRNAITNVDPSTITPRAIDLPTFAEADRSHPLCTPAELLTKLRKIEQPSLQLCLRDDISGATAAATCDRELEDIGSTLAAMGRFEDAAAFIAAQAVEDFRRDAVHSVILLEKCRRQLPGIVEILKQSQSGNHGSLSVSLALIGRLPWICYPLADW